MGQMPGGRISGPRPIRLPWARYRTANCGGPQNRNGGLGPLEHIVAHETELVRIPPVPISSVAVEKLVREIGVLRVRHQVAGQCVVICGANQWRAEVGPQRGGCGTRRIAKRA